MRIQPRHGGNHGCILVSCLLAFNLLDTLEELYIYTSYWLVRLLKIYAGNKLYLFDFRSSPTEKEKKKKRKGGLIPGTCGYIFSNQDEHRCLLMRNKVRL